MTHLEPAREAKKKSKRRVKAKTPTGVYLPGCILGQEQVDGKGEELVALLDFPVGNHASPCGLVLVLVYRIHLFYTNKRQHANAQKLKNF